MRVLFIVPSPDANPGDAIIFGGISKLINTSMAVTFSECYYFEAPSAKIIDQNRQVTLREFDALIVCGTPWLWDKCVGSRKYEELRYLLNRYRHTKKIALGIGACLPFHFGKDLICADATIAAALRDFWQTFDLITTRDRLASEILNACGVTTHHTCCPSILSTSGYGGQAPKRHTPNRGALVFYLPQAGISRESLPEDFVDDYVSMQLALAAAKNLDIACLTETEAKYLGQRLKVDASTIRILSNADDIHAFVEGRKLLVTGRVHVAIPALMSRCDAYLLPVDSRYRTAAELGVGILWRYGTKFPVIRIKPVPLRSLAREIRKSDILIPVGMRPLPSRPDRTEYLAKVSALIRKVLSPSHSQYLQPSTPAYERIVQDTTGPGL